MRVGLLPFYIFYSSTTVNYISGYSLGLSEYVEPDGGEPLYNAGDLYLPDISNTYQDFDPASLITPAGVDDDLFPEISQEHDATGAVLYDLIQWDLPI